MRKRKLRLATSVCGISIALFLILFLRYGHPEWFGSTPEVPKDTISTDLENSNTENNSEDISDDTSSTTESATESVTEGATTEKPDTEQNTQTVVKKPLTYLEQCELDYVEPPVRRDYEQTLAKLKELSLWFPALHNVYDNADKFTMDLLGALAGNPEMTDFAAGMLYRAPVATGGFTEDERPEDFPLLLQWDIRWGYVPYGNSGNNVGIAGCGPTCLSMASFYLSGDRHWTPDAIAKFSEENGYYFAGAGTAWALLDEFPAQVGLTSARVSKTEKKLKAELDKGNVLICSVRLGNFTSGGHFIVIYGYDENGFKVNDPKCIYRSRLSWTYEQIKNDIKQTWSIGK